MNKSIDKVLIYYQSSEQFLGYSTDIENTLYINTKQHTSYNTPVSLTTAEVKRSREKVRKMSETLDELKLEIDGAKSTLPSIPKQSSGSKFSSWNVPNQGV